MLATKSSRSPGVLPGWRVGAADAVVGPSDTPGTLLFLSRTVAGVGAAVLLSCVRGVTSELGNICVTLLSRNGLFPSREKLRESRSPSLGSHRPLRGVIPVRLPRSWLSRDGSFRCGDGPEGCVGLVFNVNDCGYGGDPATDREFSYRVSGCGSCRCQSFLLKTCCAGCVGRAGSPFGVTLSRVRVSTTPIVLSPANDLCGYVRSALLASRRMFHVDTMIPEHFVGGAGA